MNKIEMTRKKKIGIGVALAAAVVIIVGIVLAVPSYNSETALDADGQENIAVETAAEKDDASAKDASDSEEESSSTSSSSNASDGAGVGGSTNSVGPTANSSGNSSGSSSGNTSSKTWVPDYKKVWVEDSAAWDEQVPIYNEIEVSICNVCGAEITGNEVAHAKQHALAGEGGGHHNDYRSVITGYETVHHDATGHYETVEDGGHWE